MTHTLRIYYLITNGKPELYTFSLRQALAWKKAKKGSEVDSFLIRKKIHDRTI
jgi:hypothetical protein